MMRTMCHVQLQEFNEPYPNPCDAQSFDFIL